MLRIVLDTNVLVAALISNRSYPFQIVYSYILPQKVLLLLSSKVLEEYTEVLNRDKFNRFRNFKNNAESLLTIFELIAEKLEPDIVLDVIDDEDDNRFLELGVVGECDFLITGNTKDFNFSEFQGIKIVSPKEFCELCEELEN